MACQNTRNGNVAMSRPKASEMKVKKQEGRRPSRRSSRLSGPMSTSSPIRKGASELSRLARSASSSVAGCSRSRKMSHYTTTGSKPTVTFDLSSADGPREGLMSPESSHSESGMSPETYEPLSDDCLAFSSDSCSGTEIENISIDAPLTPADSTAPSPKSDEDINNDALSLSKPSLEDRTENENGNENGNENENKIKDENENDHKNRNEIKMNDEIKLETNTTQQTTSAPAVSSTHTSPIPNYTSTTAADSVDVIAIADMDADSKSAGTSLKVDYIALTSTLNLLNAQKSVAESDILKLEHLKRRSMENPEQVVKELSTSGRLSEIPEMQQIVRAPMILWKKYGISNPELEKQLKQGIVSRQTGFGVCRLFGDAPGQKKLYSST
ncbi:hypothetical protein CANCADRAFT_106053 [Tortispora caseinolytica NRRL Y-17796]|uniref:Uncharacterized protein n=1 Tax=Tortispora caseinolytica NRRL Y-17796 TaxID=767744 RepID=A0A1E4TF56_9ASCO|nr:hypothetical protein CANCADRAFT_106053 [Tortispora caseinolytica NRRL Y-17796]